MPSAAPRDDTATTMAARAMIARLTAETTPTQVGIIQLRSAAGCGAVNAGPRNDHASSGAATSWARITPTTTVVSTASPTAGG